MSQPNSRESKLPASPRGFWRETWVRFRRRRLAFTALIFVGFLAIVALLSPAIVGKKPIICKYKGSLYFPALGYFHSNWENPFLRNEGLVDKYPEMLPKLDPDSWAVWPLVYQDPENPIDDNEFPGQPGNEKYSPPNRYNLFGTTGGRMDVFAQMVHGTRIALLVGLVSTGLAAFIGITLGAIAGYLGGWWDMLLSRTIELVMSIPTLILILAMLAIVEEPSIWHVMLVIGATSWTGLARLSRAEFIKLRESEFVTAARALGVPSFRIVFRHILPNALAPVLTPISFGIASAILIENSLSFLGLAPPAPSWGSLLRIAAASQLQWWWLVLFPGLTIFLTVLAYNLIGEGLQEATDPRLREAGK